MKPKKARYWVIPLLCYGAALVIYFALCGVHLLLDTVALNKGELEQRTLGVDSFFTDGVQLKENAAGQFDLVSENPDPQMIYSPGEPFKVSTFTFRAGQSNKAGGEMTLFYTTHPEDDFSEADRLWAKRHPDGNWYFDLGGRTVSALRFDPDTVGGVLWRDWEITLNEPKPVIDYFLPDARPVFALLFFPALAAAVFTEAWQVGYSYHLRRKARGKAKR